MGPFPPLFGNQYILTTIDYMSKWVEVTILPTNNAKVVVKFVMKNIFSRFGPLEQSLVIKNPFCE